MVINRVFPEQDAKAIRTVSIVADETADSTSWNDTAERWMHRLEHQLATHPRSAIGVALAVGVFLGWMIKRR